MAKGGATNGITPSLDVTRLPRPVPVVSSDVCLGDHVDKVTAISSLSILGTAAAPLLLVGCTAIVQDSPIPMLLVYVLKDKKRSPLPTAKPPAVTKTTDNESLYELNAILEELEYDNVPSAIPTLAPSVPGASAVGVAPVMGGDMSLATPELNICFPLLSPSNPLLSPSDHYEVSHIVLIGSTGMVAINARIDGVGGATSQNVGGVNNGIKYGGLFVYKISCDVGGANIDDESCSAVYFTSPDNVVVGVAHHSLVEGRGKECGLLVTVNRCGCVIVYDVKDMEIVGGCEECAYVLCTSCDDKILLARRDGGIEIWLVEQLLEHDDEGCDHLMGMYVCISSAHLLSPSLDPSRPLSSDDIAIVHSVTRQGSSVSYFAGAEHYWQEINPYMLVMPFDL